MAAFVTPSRVTHRRRVVLIASGLALLVAAALAVIFDVSIVEPQIQIRWISGLDPEARVALERQYVLRRPEWSEAETWRYELGNTSRENIAAIVRDPRVADTHKVDRTNFRAEARQYRVTFASAADLRPWARQQTFGAAFQIQTIVTLLIAAALGLATRIHKTASRALAAAACLAALTLAFLTFPMDPAAMTMGDFKNYTQSRAAFMDYTGGRTVRFEAHLAHTALSGLDRLMGATSASPAAAFLVLSWLAGVWFALSAVALGFLHRWSQEVVRYLALAIAAPATLMYFGYREFGYLSLNVAAFPLVAEGARRYCARFQIGAALYGLGAALHGFGLLSLAGTGAAAVTSPERPARRLELLIKAFVFGSAAYLIWLALYIIVFKFTIIPGHADHLPLRSLFEDRFEGPHLNPAVWSARGLRDLVYEFWVVGAPVVLIALAGLREHKAETRFALAFAFPSLVFLSVFWPKQGLGVDTDLLFGAFPGLYAALWVCAKSRRMGLAAGAVLATAHYAFWRIVFDDAFS